MQTKIITLPAAFIFFLLLFVFSFERCADKCQVKSKYDYYTPVYATSAEIKAAVGEKQPVKSRSWGKSTLRMESYSSMK